MQHGNITATVVITGEARLVLRAAKAGFGMHRPISGYLRLAKARPRGIDTHWRIGEVKAQDRSAVDASLAGLGERLTRDEVASVAEVTKLLLSWYSGQTKMPTLDVEHPRVEVALKFEGDGDAGVSALEGLADPHLPTSVQFVCHFLQPGGPRRTVRPRELPPVTSAADAASAMDDFPPVSTRFLADGQEARLRMFLERVGRIFARKEAAT